jgi:hypothetical protein
VKNAQPSPEPISGSSRTTSIERNNAPGLKISDIKMMEQQPAAAGKHRAYSDPYLLNSNSELEEDRTYLKKLKTEFVSDTYLFLTHTIILLESIS